MLPDVETCHGSTVTRVEWRWCKDHLTSGRVYRHTSTHRCTHTGVCTHGVVTEIQAGPWKMM